eukprot:GHVU01108712.1.p1 GENE.GHVU01108712.1~~GHVU01108712.1.p1  ORF type:complete len:103 (+),score=3.07 GHVU01108712.1:37-345(+)
MVLRNWLGFDTYTLRDDGPVMQRKGEMETILYSPVYEKNVWLPYLVVGLLMWESWPPIELSIASLLSHNRVLVLHTIVLFFSLNERFLPALSLFQACLYDCV